MNLSQFFHIGVLSILPEFFEHIDLTGDSKRFFPANIDPDGLVCFRRSKFDPHRRLKNDPPVKAIVDFV